ncbi:hypothetical protein [Rubrobacter indicoceani]|uniref:hypothetical protein n=1 Tax=Rubrobacter indicoceani TaxID=2051957 RepID=UPI0013C465FD|nr:hypothetical protein [Rubrobacter indicoceani]
MNGSTGCRIAAARDGVAASTFLYTEWRKGMGKGFVVFIAAMVLVLFMILALPLFQ